MHQSQAGVPPYQLGKAAMLFTLWESTNVSAFSYQDWHSKIEEGLEKGYDSAEVKEDMFTLLKAMAKEKAKMINKHSDLHTIRILDGLDSPYTVSMTFQLLNATLGGLQRKAFESPWDYYNYMTRIIAT